ncbi:hypothetical protein ABES23_06115 [Peribacillus frigoritolerans]|uniref:hypothetical protein n=1 Tax=Peribacillus frigoritolerans TaxID=450367 RepID=UPI003D2A2EE2
MAILFQVNSKIEGNGSFVVSNSMPLRSGGTGFPVNASLVVSNLSTGESVTITADGVQVLNVAANGSHAFKFTSKRRMDSNTIKIAYTVSGASSADVVLVADVPNP